MGQNENFKGEPKTLYHTVAEGTGKITGSNPDQVKGGLQFATDFKRKTIINEKNTNIKKGWEN